MIFGILSFLIFSCHSFSALFKLDTISNNTGTTTASLTFPMQGVTYYITCQLLAPCAYCTYNTINVIINNVVIKNLLSLVICCEKQQRSICKAMKNLAMLNDKE